MNNQFAIETRDLTRTFGTCKAVDGINLCVPRGAIYGFLGPNGAGKTTTIRLLLGLLRPDSGSIFLNGQPLTQNRRDLMRGVGALVETPSLYPHLTGEENLDLTRRVLDLPRSRVTDALTFAGLTADSHRLVRGYSLGMRQRLGLAQAWIGQPALMLLDEPANGLDPAGIRELRGHLRQLAHDRNVTIFLSSHVLSEIDQIADWIGIINHGRLFFQGKNQDLQRDQGPLRVAVDKSLDAATTLSANGWHVLQQSGDFISVQVASDMDVAKVNRCLHEHGIQIYRLERKQETLEDLFLRQVAN